ncbi:hypothetical protein VI08_12180 [Luteibacter yeojuensis]|uniref:Thioredoxin domain-containing protein n=1 Tax=Luteibacter yeojuensis TaxID=345309 RepID=A0A0F3KMT5_9GAMM|nr:hypothetical protein VI08_12180 [Luteibacter yeojuensis]
MADEAANVAAAPIKSEADLKAYMALLPKDSPLYLLQPLDRKVFVESLRFGEKGVTTFSTQGVFDLPPADGRKVLALVGAQDMIDPPSPSSAAATERAVPPAESFATQQLTAYEASYASLLNTTDAVYAHTARPAAVQSFFDTHFAPALAEKQLRALSSRDLAALYRSTVSTTAMFPDASHLGTMRRVYDELARRGQATDGQARDMFGALFRARDFKGLLAFRAVTRKAPEVAPITLDGQLSPRGLHRTLVVDGATVVRADVVDLARGAHIVVVASPGCHFSRDAAQAIEHDPRLAGILGGHSTWIEPTGSATDLKPWVAWNAGHPTLRIDLAASDKAWPEVTRWETPTFLFFKDGKVVDTVVGWPKEGNGPAIEKAWAHANGSTSQM